MDYDDTALATQNSHSDTMAIPHSLLNKPVSYWQAQLTLQFEQTERGSVLKRSEHKGPLYVQKAFYPEGKTLAHVYILHPPGGLVSGDHLHIDITLKNNAAALLTTPGAGRVYKARADKALQQQKVTIQAHKGATIEWLPLETILYPNANTQLDTLVKLDKSACFIGWDICCLGLPANGIGFEEGSLKQCLHIEVEGKVALRERVQLDNTNRDVFNNAIGFANHSVNALMVAGPFIKETKHHPTDTMDELINNLRDYCDITSNIINSSVGIKASGKPMCSVSMTDTFLLIRYLGDDSEQARMLFIQCWEKIRPLLLNKKACAPRIWAT